MESSAITTLFSADYLETHPIRSGLQSQTLSEEKASSILTSRIFVRAGRPDRGIRGWLKRARQRHVTELSSFANGIRRDLAAARFFCCLVFRLISLFVLGSKQALFTKSEDDPQFGYHFVTRSAGYQPDRYRSPIPTFTTNPYAKTVMMEEEGMQGIAGTSYT